MNEVAVLVNRRLAELGYELAEEYSVMCTRCGACIGVCPGYQATGDPRLTPLYRMLVAIRFIKSGELKAEDVEALFSCTGCGACTLACPLRLEIWLLIHVAKCIAQLKGLGPKSLVENAKAARRSLHSFTSNSEAAVKWIWDSKANTSAGYYLYVPTPVENYFYPSVAEDKVRLFELLGIDYVVSPVVIDIGGNMAIDLAYPELAAYALMRAVMEAERLGARRIIVSECGSDHHWVFHLAPVLLEDLGLNFKIFVSIHEVVWEQLRKTGMLRELVGRQHVALFSSCKMSRSTSFYHYISALARAAALEVEEPAWRGRYNACCGGSCLNVIREQWAKKLRVKIGFSRVMKFKSEVVVVPCTKCYISFKQSLLAHRRRDKKVVMLSSLLLNCLREALRIRDASAAMQVASQSPR